jgi:hypothetical protein
MNKRLLECYSVYLDIGRGDWDIKRTNEKYIEDFQNFWGKIEAKITLFCEEYFIDIVKKGINDFKEKNGYFKSEVSFQIFDRNELFYFKEIETIRRIQASSNMKRYSARDQSGPPEYTNAEWVAVMLSKPIIISMAKERNLIDSEAKVIAWADFGIAHCGHNDIYSNFLNGKRLVEPIEDKITFFNKRDFLPDLNPWINNSLADDVFTPGGFYLLPVNMIDEFNTKFHKIVQEDFFKNDIVDDDQHIMSIFSAKYPEISRLEDSSKYINNPPEADFFPIFYTTENI